MPAVGPDGAGQDLDEGALAGAVGAHQRVDLARADGERRVAQRDDGAVASSRRRSPRAARSVPSTVIGPVSTDDASGGRRRRAGTPVDRGRRVEVTRPGPCRRRSGPWCRSVQSGIVEADRPVRVERRDRRPPRAWPCPRRWRCPTSSRLERARCCCSARLRLAVEDLERQRDARAADGGGVGDGGALQARRRVSSSCVDEAGIVGADDRHERLRRLDLDRVDDLVVDARGPDAVERASPLAMKSWICCLPWSGSQPVNALAARP